MLVMGPECPGKLATLVRSWGQGGHRESQRWDVASFPTGLHGHGVTSSCPVAGTSGFLEKPPKAFLPLVLIPKPSLDTPNPCSHTFPSALTFRSQILIWESIVPVPKMSPSGWNWAQVRAVETAGESDTWEDSQEDWEELEGWEGSRGLGRLTGLGRYRELGIF